MAATGAADGFFRSVYEGCISGGDMGIERRPYHRNCGCALHSKSNKPRGGNRNCPNGLPKCKNISYPVRRSWSEGSLLVLAASSHHSSPSSSPLMDMGGASTSKPLQYQFGACNEEEDDDDNNNNNIASSLKV